MLTSKLNESIQKIANKFDIEAELVFAVCKIESRGSGFNPDGSIKLLFEGHWFYRYTKGEFFEDYRTICYPKWTKEFYGKTWKEENKRFAVAESLDKKAANLSTSFGMFQIMGFNHNKCGFDNVFDFVKFLRESEENQIDAFFKFIKNIKADDKLKAKDWAGFARAYNGPGYEINKYDKKLQIAYNEVKNSYIC